MPENSGFRLFVNNMYQAAMNERACYKQSPCTVQEYFDQNKFWLKNQYKNGVEVVDITV